LKISIVASKNVDRRVYNKPTTDEIAILIPNFGDSTNPTKREALTFDLKGTVKIINSNNSSYDPLMYTIMFPSGQLSWQPNSIKLTLDSESEDELESEMIDPNINKTLEVFDQDLLDDIDTLGAQDLISENQDFITNIDENNYRNDEDYNQDYQSDEIEQELAPSKSKVKKMKFVSAMQYYSYQLCDRPGNSLHLFGRLFHQYICDQFSKIELGRLNFFRHNQDKIRADVYQNIKNSNSDSLGQTIGKRIVLPSTYKGSPRNLQQSYQDAMAVIRSKGKPDLFVTVTCNPSWPEITAEIKKCPNSQKLTIIARVFRIKLQALLDDILKKHILGHVSAFMYVIEFQKRGLPHAHILIILEDDSKPRTTDEYDSIISAELPDPIKNPAAYETVTRSMLHGPCGLINPKAPCMVDGKCSKHFPKDFCENTEESQDGYPVYRRRDDGKHFVTTLRDKDNKTTKTFEMDNRWVVPHNLYLSTKYNCHINVEICSSVNYLLKNFN
jgi:hypothetical protein